MTYSNIQNVTALPTYFAGITFRSRLEARWAMVFDLLGIRWQYEPEGFAGAYDTPYLPDFWLPDLAPPIVSERWPERVPIDGVYAEVKGSGAQLERALHKIECAVDFVSTPVAAGLLLLGPIPGPNRHPAAHSMLAWHKGVVVHHVRFSKYARRSTLLLVDQYVGTIGDHGLELLEPDVDVPLILGDHDPARAYAAARAHRFRP